MSRATYRLYIDWDGDGSIQEGDGFYFPWQLSAGAGIPETEDMSYRIRSSPGIRTTRGKDQIRSIAPPMAGRFDAELDNIDRELSPENTGSSLFGNLIPGRLMQLQAIHQGEVYKLWTGNLDDLPQYPSRGRRTVGVPALGPFAKLVGKKVSTAVYQNIRTDEALGYILDAVGWSASDRVLDIGSTTLTWWWLEEEDAFEAAKTLLNSEGPGASLYEDGLGRIVFEGRSYRRTQSRSTTSQATFSDSGTEPLHSEPFVYNPGLKDIRNVAELTVKTREAQSISVVWTLGETVTLAAGQTRKYVAKSSDPFINAVTPVASTDYTITAGSLASVTLDRTSGQSVTITLIGGASGATITGLQLRAESVTVQTTTAVANTVDTSTSIGKFGRQVYTLANRFEIDVNVAQDLANAVVGIYQNPRPTVTISVLNANDTRMTQILERQISDRITIVETQTGVSGDYWIDYIAHSIDNAGFRHQIMLGCEQIADSQYGIWGDARWDFSLWGF